MWPLNTTDRWKPFLHILVLHRYNILSTLSLYIINVNGLHIWSSFSVSSFIIRIVAPRYVTETHRTCVGHCLFSGKSPILSMMFLPIKLSNITCLVTSCLVHYLGPSPYSHRGGYFDKYFGPFVGSWSIANWQIVLEIVSGIRNTFVCYPCMPACRCNLATTSILIFVLKYIHDRD